MDVVVAMYNIILGIQIIVPELHDHLIKEDLMEGIWWAYIPFFSIFGTW